ncbi:MAG: HEAT repeat domain-containing protein [Akkermansiaceae bacterium]|nr:HEAT repeat domain-containing protein [Akkermansiaceae bacterium]
MKIRPSTTTLLAGILCCLFALWLNLPADDSIPLEPPLEAGAHVQDVTPPFDSLLINGSFTERRRGKMNPGDLKARCFVLRRGDTRIAIAVVDSCMIPRDVCDEAKQLAFKATGIPTENILITATHTHSAPSTMDYCLGTMADPAYTEFLPPKIAEGITHAFKKLQPARIGWQQVAATGYTHCRRFITRPDQMLTDPFGEKSVRAMMHPGYQNPNYIGPSGPVDDELSLLSIQTLDGKPLGVLANFSMHYHSGGGPADYFGLYSDRLAEQLTVDGHTPVCAMTQGTSGDLYRVDYRGEKKPDDISRYTNDLVRVSQEALKRTTYLNAPPLGMTEDILTLKRRLPDQKRLAWADQLLEPMKGRRPKTRPEVYAEQARYLDANPTEKVVLQSLRIGDLAITATPNEVYSITGLKLKARSPFKSTFNIELANGAAGYIPPPEQHTLGGYTTWPARTAGLEVQAEPKIVNTILKQLESLSGQPRRQLTTRQSTYANTILADKPLAYWQCEEFDGNTITDFSGNNRHGTIDGQVAYHLPGPEQKSLEGIAHNASLQLVGGTVSATVPNARSLTFWFWNGMITAARDNTGDLVQNGDLRLRIGGKGDGKSEGRLILQSPNQSLTGASLIKRHHWHHLTASTDGETISIFLDGQAEITAPLPGLPSDHWRFGGTLPIEGRIDEVAWFATALTQKDATRFFTLASTRDSAPLSPTDSLKAIHVPDGYEVQLVAAEPLIQDPVAIDWAPDGRLWVAEMADYPSGIDGKPGGRVRLLSDTDNDGVFDQSFLFLEGLNFPAGIMSWKKGALIAAAPDIIYAEDTNGDGKADLQEILFTGFKQGNQQLRVNGLSWGLDNHIHGANGSHHSGYAAGTKITSPVSNQTFNLDSFDFRMQPDQGILEPLSGPSQFGRTRDDWGNWFGVQNSFPLWHYVLEQRYLARNPDFAAPDPRRQLFPRNPPVFQATPSQKRFHSFNNSGRFTSACSPMIYRDDLLFQDDQIHAFTCEPFHNLVQHMILKRDGCSFTAERARGELDFFASEDRWSRPVMARTGPDGALWVVDMYRYMIEHPDWLPKEGQSEMQEHERKGSSHGRIYRVIPKDKKTAAFPRLDKASPTQLVAHLAHSNGVVRDLAHRLLVEKKAVFVTDLLIEVAKTLPGPKARLHALCVLDGIDRLTPDLLASALSDAHPQIRRHALRLAESRWQEDPKLLTAALKLSDDPEPAVRLQAACSLGVSNFPDAGKALARIAVKDHASPFVRAAVFASTHLHFDHLASAALENGILIDDLIKLGGKQKSLNALITRLATPGKNGFTADQFKALGTWLDHNPKAISKLNQAITAARQIAARKNSPIPLRVAAISLLGRQTSDQALLSSLLTKNSPSSLKLASIDALARIAPSNLPETLFQNWPTHSTDERTRIIDVLFRRSAWTKATLTALQNKTISPTDLDASRRQLLLTHSDPAIREQTSQLLQSSSKKLTSFLPALKLKGDKTAGRKTFDQLCAVCHLPAKGLPANGPDLRSITDRSKEGLFTSILDPNQSIDPTYESHLATLPDGSTLFGRILSQNQTHLTLRQLDGSDRQLSRKTLKSLQKTGRSLMPEGLESAMSQQDLANLISFLQGFGNERK